MARRTSARLLASEVRPGDGDGTRRVLGLGAVRQEPGHGFPAAAESGDASFLSQAELPDSDRRGLHQGPGHVGHHGRRRGPIRAAEHSVQEGAATSSRILYAPEMMTGLAVCWD
ncbi:uncharacterized protein LOC144100702 [Amblyomma americanum]